MENKIVTRSLRKQLDQVVFHEQVEKGATINNNLSADQVEYHLKHLEEFLE